MGNIVKQNKGFTLIELMVVVIIVGILATVAVPIYRGQVIRARASEGEALLGSVVTGQRVHQVEFDTFTTNQDLIGVVVEGNRFFGGYVVTAADADGFAAVTTSNTTPPITVDILFDRTNGARLRIQSDGRIYKNEID